ncbi:MAG: SDR family oxidoreductase [Akkermansiaceae bacterium]|nr:SDR family oxidoreductase [Akkermansiaceae bacterium]NNM28733.1 SDR family oxidoreductase [Akkermansiaceae bacterium]
MGPGWRYECALVTGASAGLGEEFARQLAPHCARMVLVARREDRLHALEAALREAHPHLEVGSIPVDLAGEAGRRELITRLHEAGWHPTLLVNNAGMGDYGEFATSDWEKTQGMISLNITALTHLTHAFLPEMISGGEGGIINVSSLAGQLPIPDIGVYAATKAYVTSFSEALRIELREHGIPVVAVCPGPVRTEFEEVAARNRARSDVAQRDWFLVDKGEVVAEALRGLRAGRALVFPGWKVALVATAISIMPAVLIRLAMSGRPRRVDRD